MTEVHDEEKNDDPPVSKISYVLYYLLLFFAYWFGASRFDFDGDGDFDPTDVEAYLHNAGFLKNNFKKKKKSAKRKKGQKKGATAQAVAKPQAAEGGIPGLGGLGGFPDLAGFDANGDGEVDFMDAFENAVEDGEAAEDQMFQTQRLPLFIITQCLVAFGLWAYFGAKQVFEEGKDLYDIVVMKAGMDSIDPGKYDLRIHDDNCTDFRFEPWRWWSYQFTHVGAMHIMMNCFLNVMLGVPLEGLHGTFKLFMMFNIGVIGGACCFFFNDAHTTVVGMSGGCYALIGMHIGNVIMNWDQLKFRKPILFFLAVLVGVDVGSFLLSVGAHNASHSAHMGGAVAGAIIGILIGDNLKVTQLERVVQGFFLFVAVVCVGFSLTWLGTQWPPRNIWGDVGWCWMRQVWKFPMTKFECVRCGDTDCMKTWVDWAGEHIGKVNFENCQESGWYKEEKANLLTNLGNLEELKVPGQ